MISPLSNKKINFMFVEIDFESNWISKDFEKV
jgi:hypothetical protein